jgi:hypothetical protein
MNFSKKGGMKKLIILLVFISFFTTASSYAKANVTIQIEIREGWNNISIPLSDISSITQDPPGTIDPLRLHYNPVTGGYETGFLQTGSGMAPEYGYWVYANNDGTLYAGGSQLSDTYSVPVYTGWNQVSSPYMNDILWGDTKVKKDGQTLSLIDAVNPPNEWLSLLLLWYNPAQGRYETIIHTDYVQGYKGCWLSVNENCDIVFEPNNGFAPNTAYNWQVIAKNADGLETEGPLWSFTTGTVSGYGIQTIQDDNEIEKVAKNFVKAEKTRPDTTTLYSKELSQIPDAAVKSVEKLKNEGGQLLAYVVSLEPKGYIVISANRAFGPIIAFSFINDFVMEESPENPLPSIIKKDLTMRLTALNKNLISQDIINESEIKWREYLSGCSVKGDVEAKYTKGPLIGFPTWRQGSPYNDLCPEYNGDKAYVGCTATSMAQICNYHGFPNQIDFTTSDNYYTSTRNIFVQAYPDAQCNIKYKDSLLPDTEKAALSFACGVLVDMDYYLDDSGSSGAYIAPYSGYEEACAYYGMRRMGYSSTQYSFGFNRNETINNINGDMPVMMSIVGPPGGHAIVVDGYRSDDGLFHMNMGWGGSYDGWYNIPDGMPYGFNAVPDDTLQHNPAISHSSFEFWSGEYDRRKYRIVLER